MHTRRSGTETTARLLPSRLLFVIVSSIVLLILSGRVPLFGQDTDEDIFGEEEKTVEPVAGDTSIRNMFLETDGVSLLGTFSGSVDTVFIWNDPWDGSFDLFDPAERFMRPQASVSLGFSAKPSTDLGFYGEVRTSYPFTTQSSVSVTNPGTVLPGDEETYTGTAIVPDIKVFKLYSRFNWKDTVFFSFGKQPLKWGKGLFFAPANDIFALSLIDYLDPEAEREGPLSLRINAPIPGLLLSNISFITVWKGASIDPENLAVASRFEIAFPGFEVSASAYYQKDDKLKLISGASYARNEWGLFGEGVLSFGSRKVFLVEADGVYSLEERPDDPFFTGTIGGTYRKSWEKKLDLMIMAQYLYDGEGQDTLSLNDLSNALLQNPTFGLSIPRFGVRLGRHYGAVSMNLGNIFDSNVSFSVYSQANLGDFSGFVRPELSWKIFDRMTVSLWSLISFGSEGDEYTNLGGLQKIFLPLQNGQFPIPDEYLVPVIQAGISFTFGSGSF